MCSLCRSDFGCVIGCPNRPDDDPDALTQEEIDAIKADIEYERSME